ncbi:protein FAM185A [Battus philenor]|uniref:protein FAM185A n=1 Tax=Battus philenor TaxID=42288 RepID=UPI0035CF0D53
MFSLGRQRILHKCLKVLRLTVLDFCSLPDLKKLNIVRTVEKTIDNNTSIFIESPIHVKVQPIDVNDIGAHNKLTMTLYSEGKDASDFQVKQTSKRLELLNKNTSTDRNDVCVIQVPYKLNVQVTTTESASVFLAKLEGAEFVVQTEKGTVNVADIKANNIKVESKEGQVNTGGRLQASNIELKTGLNSGINCHNIMANSFIVTTHAGPIAVKSCYSDKSHFTTLMGNIRLDHLHRSVMIDVIKQGNLYIASFSGNLQASLKSGEVFMHASQLTEKSSIFIHEKGKVELLIPDIINNLPATNLIAEKITVDDKIMKLGRFMDDSHPKRFRFEKEPQNELHIVCKNGSIELKETHLPFIV